MQRGLGAAGVLQNSCGQLGCWEEQGPALRVSSQYVVVRGKLASHSVIL